MMVNLKYVKRLVSQHSMFKVQKHSKYDLFLYSYRYVDPSVFKDPVAREIRGIVFDSKGNIVSRPFHKFFNYGESLCTVDGSEYTVSTEKLDGSLLIGFTYKDEIIFASKGSFKSNVVRRAYKMLNKNIESIIRDFKGYTVLFELIDSEFPIVIDYKEDAIKLIGIRKNDTGKYIEPEELIEIAKSYNIQHTNIIHKNKKIEDIVHDVKQWKNVEGVVCYASDLCKIKSKWYLSKHKIVSHILSGNPENKIKKLLINNKLDDIYPELPDVHKKVVDDVVKKAMAQIKRFENSIKEILNDVSGMSRKDAAKYMIDKKIDKCKMNIVFSLLDKNYTDDDIRSKVYNYFKKIWG